MGANMVRRLIKNGHTCVVFDRSPEAVSQLSKEKAVGANSLADFVRRLDTPRVIWLMVPAAVVDETINDLLTLLDAEDILIDGGNSYYVDDIRRARELALKDIHYVDVGTSGGVWGLERGYCMMIGGEADVVAHLDPIFATLAPGAGDIPKTPGREQRKGTAEQGYLHCGPNGAGHFVKMVTTVSSTESWLPMRKEWACCRRRMSASRNTELTPRPRHFAIRSFTSMTSICRTLQSFGVVAV